VPADDIRVSAIVPAYNAGRFIRETVASALAQTFSALEVVVVEDGSKEPVEWIAELDPKRVRYHRKENGGPASARNVAVQLARGEFVAFLDADDLWDPTKIERQVAALDADPRAAFVYGTFRGIDDQGRPCRRVIHERPAGDVAEALFMYNFVTASGVMARRQMFLDVGGFDQSPALIAVEDYDLWLRLAERHRVCALDGEIGSYRITDASLSRNFARLYRGERLVLERAVARNARPEFRARLGERLGRHHFELGYNYLSARQFGEARQEFARSLRKWPWSRKTWIGLGRAALSVAPRA
jgi:glycosyltransferase involved in cell wall biosynthesis